MLGFASGTNLHASEAPPAKGVVIPRVVCAEHPEQSYALYLPSNYTPKGKWPILYLFDPAARGSLPVILAKDAAEKFGYIVIGSNNSRNGPTKPRLDAAVALWNDSHRRFMIDDRRVYFAGFSGGARIAASVALGCNDCAAGVISSGAGFPANQPPTAQVHFSYFATIGRSDFNYPEAVELAQQLDRLNLPHRLRSFDGSHEWAPAEIWPEALAWMNLLAMKQDRLARDPTFIAQQFEAETRRAQEFEKRGEIYSAWQEYRSVASDFAGLLDVASVAKHADELNLSPALREAKKQERKDFDGQQVLTGAVFSGMAALAEGKGDQVQICHQLLGQITALRNAKEREENEDRRRVIGRALGQLLTFAKESAEDRMRAGDAALALIYFELAREASPKEAWLLVGEARAQALLGNKKNAMEALRRAREMGVDDESLQGVIRDNADFARYRDDPDFLKLLAEFAAK